ncbi:hypothetical protein [Undibacterium sp. Xuan67W]|uniref:hypothetical protein n=1 Tax=Undibacterium sp. Xuan67W TaxID=3413057 RepID=UPI003BF3B638
MTHSIRRNCFALSPYAEIAPYGVSIGATDRVGDGFKTTTVGIGGAEFAIG